MHKLTHYYIRLRIITVKNTSIIRRKSIKPNRSSFEPGSAEHNFAREKVLPSENDVNALFDSMLVI